MDIIIDNADAKSKNLFSIISEISGLQEPINLYLKNFKSPNIEAIATALRNVGLSKFVHALHFDFGGIFKLPFGGWNEYPNTGELSQPTYVLPKTFFPNLKELSLISAQYQYSMLSIEQPLQRLYAVGLATLEGINLSEIEVLHLPLCSRLETLKPLKGLKTLECLDISHSNCLDFEPILSCINLKLLSANAGKANLKFFEPLHRLGCSIKLC